MTDKMLAFLFKIFYFSSMDSGGKKKTSNSRLLASYGMAIAAVGLAMLLRHPFSAHLGPRLIYVTFSPAVMLAATLGGLGPGLLATLSAALLVTFWILPPPGQLLPLTAPDAVGLALFSCSGVVMSVFAGLYHKSRRRMEDYEKLLIVRESEARFRAFFEKAAVGAAQVDMSGRFTQVNDCYCRMTGYSRDELLQMTPYQITHPDDREFDRHQHQLFQVGRIPAYEAEKRYVRKDGSVIWVHVTAGLLHDANARPVGTAGIIQDISERRRTEEALRENEQEFRAFFDNAAVGAGQLDRTGRFVRVNGRLSQITGYSREELLQMTPLDITHPDDRRREFEGSQALMRGEAPVHNLEKRYIRKDGQVIWVQVSAGLARDAEGKPLRSVGIIQEITDRKNAETQLRTLAAVVENSSDFIGLSTPAMEPFFLNEAGRRMVGLEHAEVSRRPLLDYYWPEDRPLITSEALPALRKNGRWSGEVRLRNFKTGDPIHTLWNMFEIKDGAGNLIAWATVSPNISSRKRMEEDLRAAKEAAEEASRAKSEFLANMSHEIRTPMTVFMAAIEFLLQNDRNEDRRRLLQMADKSAAQLRALIEDILDLAKVEARKLELQEEPFDLRDCVRNAIEMASIPAREKDLRLEMKVGAGVPQITVGDRNRLGQVLLNLVANAVKFTEEGEVIVSVEVRGRDFLFAVSDTGIGIPEEKRNLLFQNFSQVDASPARKGAGLGLAICKGLVELMGGKIEMHSREEGGSVFSFALPLKAAKNREEGLPSEPEEEKSGAAPADTCILLAEDDPMVQDMIRLLLARRGLRVQTAASGREAVEKWQAGHFDLILMDVQMPELDGLEATRTIRRLERESGGHTRIIGITAHARREIREEGLQAGMDDFLTKPLRLSELLAKIDLRLADGPPLRPASVRT